MNKNKKILVVEDEITLSDAIAAKLSIDGFKVFIANNGVDGLLLAEKELPDMILLDIVMPKMDGMEMLKELRNKDWGKEMPVIILTNFSDNKKIAESIKHGTFDYLIKADWRIDDIVKLVKEKLNVK